MGDMSFVDKRQSYQKLAPPPKYLNKEDLLRYMAIIMPTEKLEILKGFDFPDCGGLICTDEEMLNKQKGVLSHVVKQLAVNLMKGLSISHISLPIKIFEPRSSIQRICDLWTFAPVYLKKAAQTDDHLERLKLVIAFCVSSIYMCCN